MHYEPGYAYPLVVWLHGPADSERQLVRIMPLLSTRNYVAVAPRGTKRQRSVAGAPEGFGWEQEEDQIREAARRVRACIELARQKCHVAPMRVFLGGFDVGGTMALRVGVESPGTFAGVLSFGGHFPSSGAPLRHLRELRGMPVFLAAGRDSETYPPNRANTDARLLHQAGLAVTLRCYPCGQEIAPQVLDDLNRWLIAQIHSQAGNGPAF
jgi:phospholipase/carboxylesterase